MDEHRVVQILALTQPPQRGLLHPAAPLDGEDRRESSRSTAHAQRAGVWPGKCFPVREPNAGGRRPGEGRSAREQASKTPAACVAPAAFEPRAAMTVRRRSRAARRGAPIARKQSRLHDRALAVRGRGDTRPWRRRSSPPVLSLPRRAQDAADDSCGPHLATRCENVRYQRAAHRRRQRMAAYALSRRSLRQVEHVQPSSDVVDRLGRTTQDHPEYSQPVVESACSFLRHMHRSSPGRSDVVALTANVVCVLYLCSMRDLATPPTCLACETARVTGWQAVAARVVTTIGSP